MRYHNLTIVGTSHIARESIEEVEKEVANKPDLVAVELDRLRLEGLLEKKKRKVHLADIFKIGVTGYVFTLIGAWVQKKLGQVVGVMPGTEMLTAIKLAKKNNIPIALIDQDISITLRRLSAAITWKERLRFVYDIFYTVIFRKREMKRLGLEKFDLTKVPAKKLIRKLTQELKKKYPNVYKVLVEERNKVMAKNLAKLMKEDVNKKILAVVGAGHEEDLLDLIKEELKAKDKPNQNITYEFTIS